MFKKGDKVLALESSGRVKAGVRYFVEKSDSSFTHVEGIYGGYYTSRFELVETVKETPVMTTTEFKVGDRVKINGVIQPETITEINVGTTYTLSGPLGGGWFAGSLTKLPDERWQALTWKEKAHITPQLSSKQYTSEQAVKDEWKNSDFFIRAVQIA